MKKLIIACIALLGATSIQAQQDAMFTHYAFNTLSVNSGYAGTRDALTVTALHRSQWVGFDGAPVTQTLTLHTPMMNDKLGIGLSVLNDKIGPVNTTSAYVDLAYKLPINDVARLSFGLKGGINTMQANLSTLETTTPGDVELAQNIESQLLPNFGFGMYYYTTKWYLGVSTPKLMENEFEGVNAGTTTSIASERRHYFFIAGTVFNLIEDGSIKMKPTTFVKMTNGAPIEADITSMFIFRDRFELGAMYRTGDAAGVLLGFNLNEQLRVGYSYDFSFLNRTLKYNDGSHEIMIRYDFIYGNKEKIRSPRYF